MSKFGVCVLSLGYTRLAGLTVYDSKTREFIETKPKDAKRLIESGMLYGVKYNKEKEYFVPDPDFNMHDLLIKSGVGNYRSMLNEVPGQVVTTAYMVVRVLNTNVGHIYEIISNKCQRVKLTEEQLRGLNNIGNVAGVFITDDEIKICEGVVIENRVYPEDTQFVGLPINAEGAVQSMMDENSGKNEEELQETPVETEESTETGGDENEEHVKTAESETPVSEEGSSLAEIFGAAEPKKSAPKKKGTKKKAENLK